MTPIYLLLFIVSFLVLRSRRKNGSVAFFHPYCNAGGGGERVLWTAIRAMQARWPKLTYVVYSGDVDATKEQILLRAKQRFGIEIEPSNVHFIFLRLRSIVEAKWYPRLTLIMQTLAGGILAMEALLRWNPSVFVDSMGYPLSLPIFKWLGGSNVAAYVHYPTISCDMIDLVSRRESSYNNSSTIAQSSLLSTLKLAYYRAFAFGYGLCGKGADVVMVNGSWTRGHITRLWNSQPHLVFPPCDINSLLSIPIRAEEILAETRQVNVLSVGQIRPEKNHRLQLEILKEMVDRFEDDKLHLKVFLTIAGGCRNEEDEGRVRELKEYAKGLGIEGRLKWALNVTYDELVQLLSTSLVSIHTMWNEHFGISVVEALAAGSITVAHDSGGPKMDIVVPSEGKERVGYLATSAKEYCKCIVDIMSLSPSERDSIRNRARESSLRFSEEEFDERWNECITPLLVGLA